MSGIIFNFFGVTENCIKFVNEVNQKLSQIFKKIPELEPASKLESFILAKIERERNRIIREKKALAFAGLFGSALAAVYAISAFGQEIVQSDFWRIISLIGSDINIIAGSWYDYALSLLETFPALHAALILAPAFVFLLSLNFYFNSINPPRLNTPHWRGPQSGI